MKTWVYIDHFKGQVVPATWEALGLAKTFGAVTALIFGANVEALAETAFEFGADEVLLADDPSTLPAVAGQSSILGDFRAEAYASTLSALASSFSPDLILFPTTTRSRELAAMSAVDLGSGVIVDAIALERDGDRLIATRAIYEGKLFEKVTCAAKPLFVTLRGRAFPRPTRDVGRRGLVTRVAVKAQALTTVEGDVVEAQGALSLADAVVVVAAGRGVLKPAGVDEKQGLVLIEELAAVLGGAVGASRPPVEAGYVPAAQLIGQSGKVVSPDLYIAVGISGAPQHIVGMHSARLVVAINKDAQAPIFTVARYGVVGDLFQILPALTAAFKRKLGK
jgi:electron transfer flavoprotein alpha subunit